MSLTLKRNTEYMKTSHTCGFDGLLVKKRKSSDALKGSMKNMEVKRKVFNIVKLLLHHIFATPFTKMENDLVNDGNHHYFEDVLQKIEENKYEDSQQVFDDLVDILEATTRTNKEVNTMLLGNNGIEVKKITYSKEDVELMANQMRKKIYNLEKNLFREELEVNQNEEKQDLEIIQPMDDLDKTFKTLQSRFPAVPALILMTKALDISLSKSLDLDFIRNELEETNKKYQPKFKSYKFFPSRKHDFNMDKVIHSYIAGYQFHKMITKLSNSPVPMRTILNMSDAIESITYIENKESTEAYKKQKDVFEKQGKVDENINVEEMLLFHGTAVASLDSILNSNFIVDALPQQLNTQNEQRKKTMMFGRGVYFSELPAISLMYGNGLLLCKVMPGNCERFKPQGVPPPEISAEYDSREVESNNSQGVIHVVKSPAQILPYCVIQLKKQSLSSQYTKPSQCVQPNHPASHSKAQDQTQAGWSVVKADQSKAHSKLIRVQKTMQNYTFPAASSADQQTCSICCDLLSNEPAVSLARCGHKFHSLCVQELTAHQAGQQHIQCPNCQTIQGVKTGNQPIGGEMKWRKDNGKVPGYPDCGVIVIKYSMADGVQEECHPHPGKPFQAKGYPRTAILPDNQQGNVVLALLIKAFQRRLIFTVGPSLSRGEEDCVTWNGIHHKTVLQDAGSGHGYPDGGYLDRVVEELKQIGVE
eukprot:GFUD01130881.1.p1 GENE.GFUD01130881.1~~GFUD01130881.1.p1  ORF type:complete len:702 (+),score=200.18 GFUD01130881.1:81-2186(+)